MMRPKRIRRVLPTAFSMFTGGLAVDAAAQEPVPPHVTFTMESAALGETRRINVYTPPNYTPGAEYPVLYMPDGGVQEDFPHIAATVDAGIRAHQMRPLIVVGIENTERRRDMTGPTEVEEDRAIAPRVGGSAAFRRFIAQELIPEVGRRYRLTGESAIIGESLAGLFVVETFVLQPELFDVYIALSPSLWWNGEALVRMAGERLRDRPGLEGRLYLSSADEEEIVNASARLEQVLREHAPAGLRWWYRPRPDLTHATIYRALAPQVLREVFKPVLARLHQGAPLNLLDNLGSRASSCVDHPPGFGGKAEPQQHGETLRRALPVNGPRTSIQIRPASVADVAQMHRVRMSVRENQLADPAWIQHRDYVEMLTERGRGWVAEADGRVVGFAVADRSRMNVWALFVDPTEEGRGVGSRLHDAMMEWFFTSAGAERVWLSTDPGTRAERFYQAAGWRYTGPEPNGEARYELSRDEWAAEQDG